MKLQAFRIKRFRSIVDTGFQDLSPDGISLIVGQNESGKSTVLEGIHAFETGVISVDDIRSNDSSPEVTCIFQFDSFAELADCLPEGKELPKGFKKTFEKLGKNVALTRLWEQDYESGLLEIENAELGSLWDGAEESAELADATPEATGPEGPTPPDIITQEDFADEVFSSLPQITMFEEDSLLPPTIDLDVLVKKDNKAAGYEGAQNFLLIADIQAEDLQNASNIRIVEDQLEAKNKKVNVELQKYWHQTVGKKDKIEVIAELKHHKNSVEGKQGQPYLAFWIRDKNGKLSPVQRSKGVKWFISFYLKLEAAAKEDRRQVFLIDEPGANLHARAQEDILQVFEKQKAGLQIIFTTHSPYLLNVDKVYRVLAVERADTEDDKSETRVIPFQELGSASVDTLLPLYTNMGVDASHQTVIKKDNNVILEEISAYFYLKAFWTIFGKTERVSFLPATGCPNVPLLANLMLGWGLSFAIVLDDDAHGRKTLKVLKDSRVCSDDSLIKIDGCSGIEDLFSNSDFSSIVLGKAKGKINTSNSEWIKREKISKVITARDFMIAVNDGKVVKGDLSAETRGRIEKLLADIVAAL